MSAVSSLNTKALGTTHYASLSGGSVGSSTTAAKASAVAAAALIPKAYEIGSPEQPVTYEELEDALKTLSQKPLNLLVIYAKNVVINTDPGILPLEPKKLILVGATIEHKPFGSSAAGLRFDTGALRTGKWESVSAFLAMSAKSRVGIPVRYGSADTLTYKASTVEEALKQKPYLAEHYRMIIEVPLPAKPIPKKAQAIKIGS